MRRVLIVLSSALLLIAATPKKKAGGRTDWKNVEQAIGRSGSLLPGDVYKVSFPRSDLSVTLDGVVLKPALALGSWAAFHGAGGHTMTMGDLVLLESEVSPVIDALQQGGIEQSAVHNHLIGESPQVMYVHFAGHGDAVALARTLHEALSRTKTPMDPLPPPETPPAIDLPTASLEHILGRSGKTAGGTYQFAISRSEKIVEHGEEVPPSMGMAIPLNFQPTGNGRAAITGDFMLLASEVNPVIRILRRGGIEVTALHSHMLEETPRLFFIHFWANDDAEKLATTLRAALDAIHVKK